MNDLRTLSHATTLLHQEVDPALQCAGSFRRACQRLKMARAIEGRSRTARKAELRHQATRAFSRALQDMDVALAELAFAKPTTVEGCAAMLEIAAERFSVKFDHVGHPSVMGPAAAVRIIDAVRAALSAGGLARSPHQTPTPATTEPARADPCHDTSRTGSPLAFHHLSMVAAAA